MSPSLRNPATIPLARTSVSARSGTLRRRGFTLVELLMAGSIASMLTLALGGVVIAVQSARQHTINYEESTAQATAAWERVRYIASQAGVYQLSGQSTRLGLRVAYRDWGTYRLPVALVVWSGGRSGKLGSGNVLTRLPQVRELLIVTYAPDAPQRLVELAFPGNSTEFDFTASNFDSTVSTLISSTGAERITLCDRLRVDSLSGGGQMTSPGVGNINFRIEMSPDDASVQSTTPGTQAWLDLRWAQSIASNSSGMRQATLHGEMQIEPRGTAVAGNSIAIPFFGSASYRYVHRK